MTIVRRAGCNNSSTNVSTSGNTLSRIKPGWSQYVFPREDTVPADTYYSLIVHIEHTLTQSKREKAIAVYYDIAKFSDYNKKANKLFKNGEKLNVLHIKQVYPIESDAYDRFVDAMYEELGLDSNEEITFDMCIGLTEAITIGYVSRTGIGGINSRRYWDDKAFVEYYNYQQEAYASAYEDYDEYGNPI